MNVNHNLGFMWQMNLDPINKFKEKKFNCYVTKVHLATDSLSVLLADVTSVKVLERPAPLRQRVIFSSEAANHEWRPIRGKNTSSDLMELAALTCPSTNYTEKEKYVPRDRIIMLFPFM